MSANVKYSKPFSHTIGDDSYQVSVTDIRCGSAQYAVTKNDTTGLYMIAEYKKSSWVGSNRDGWNTSPTPTVSHIGNSHQTAQDAIQWLLLIVEQNSKIAV